MNLDSLTFIRHINNLFLTKTLEMRAGLLWMSAALCFPIVNRTDSGLEANYSHDEML